MPKFVMDKIEFLQLLEKYNAGLANAEEIAFLNAYYDLFDQEEDGFAQINSTQKNVLKNEIAEEIKSQISVLAQEEIKSLPLFVKYKWLAIAAVLVLISSLTILFFNNESPKEQIVIANPKPVKNTIVPGSNNAVLTLANGNQISLNDKENGVLASQSGVIITKNKDGQLQYQIKANAPAGINTISTPRGGQYQLILVDGTKVWLNAASSITFPTQFKGAERKVEIVGEAYFEVAKNANKPFKVKSKNQIIEVLGTHFNVNTYDDEAADKTTLLEGSVSVSKIANGKVQTATSKILKPGQQATVNANQSQILVAIADEDEAIAWKNGYFKFNKADIQTIMRQVSRWYNVDVEFKGEMNKDLFVGKINRSEHVEEVLSILERSKINVAIKGRTIIISN
ncbi:FecR family protein [Pedobacter cryotolerans]|uniref:FecR family protein n=1 Tax=Pedobacter cryotolerans TaxID=2571270 RepID=A0A4U1C3J0_9SPHI|nr:FecR family protein [Pedobacter cryotolerans]TKB99681.1 FecR family protein [Pedobacter cryotolerans]